jgi:hypothetical protein
MCIEKNCKLRYTHNYPNIKRGDYCYKHKKDGMIKVHIKLCIEHNCNRYAYYNESINKFPEYCSEHKKDGMINLHHRNICIEYNCDKIAYFNNIDNKQAEYCSDHKKDGMVNVNSVICTFQTCLLRASYNYNELKIPIYCSKHKLENMINIKSKKCLETNCNTIPTFNLKGETKSLYCAKHKQKEMIDIKSNKCCNIDCNKQANYNYKNIKAGLYCVSHKLENMIDVKHKTCKTELCDILVTKRNDGYCVRCYIHMFPDKPILRNFKTKENYIVEFIKKEFPDLTWITDKRIYDGCSKRRPDLLLDLGYQVIIIEIDENQHNDYDCSCENKRIMELSQDVNHRPIIFIRFNPDGYNNDNVNITSCWEIGKMGIYHIKESKKKNGIIV